MRTRLLTVALAVVLLSISTAHAKDTGQTGCYDLTGTQIACPQPGEPLFGQDGNYIGTLPAYQDNGDGTITDLNTGLIWQKSPGQKLTWDDAVAQAETINLGGNTDWRVPTITELYSLMDFNGVTGKTAEASIPYLDTTYFDFKYGDESAGERFIDSQFWSSTVYVSTTMFDAETVFGVNFADGRIKGYPKFRSESGEANQLYVRYVRGDAYGVNAFVDNGNGTITDSTSGLMWLQADSGALGGGTRGDGSMDWAEALAWCESLTYAGFDDWRLPDAKELQGIVDYTRSPDTTNSAAIDPIFKTTASSDPDGNSHYPYFWTSTTHLDGDQPGMRAVYVAFGKALGYLEDRNGNRTLMDVHGAGAQRSDPKSGDPSQVIAEAPQGDVWIIYNFARCVRGGDVTVVTGGEVPANPGGQPQGQQGGQQPPGQQGGQQGGQTQGQQPPGQQGGQQQGQQPPGQQGGGGPAQPPQEAINACANLNSGDSCTINTPRGTLEGTCNVIGSVMACVPAGGGGPPPGGPGG